MRFRVQLKPLEKDIELIEEMRDIWHPPPPEPLIPPPLPNTKRETWNKRYSDALANYRLLCGMVEDSYNVSQFLLSSVTVESVLPLSKMECHKLIRRLSRTEYLAHYYKKGDVFEMSASNAPKLYRNRVKLLKNGSQDHKYYQRRMRDKTPGYLHSSANKYSAKVCCNATGARLVISADYSLEISCLHARKFARWLNGKYAVSQLTRIYPKLKKFFFSFTMIHSKSKWTFYADYFQRYLNDLHEHFDFLPLCEDTTFLDLTVKNNILAKTTI